MSAVAACGACLRRGGLVGLLAPRIAAALDRPGRPSAGVLALEDRELVAAVGGRRSAQARGFLAEFDESTEREGLERAGVGAVCPHAGAYPRALLRLDDPPAALYHAGAVEALEGALNGPSVAVVGARRASAYGAEVAYGLGRGLAAAGVEVVSGLALGVDASAHRGALDGRGRPVAVLAAGVDVPYPRTNRPLHERVRRTGILLSEIPPGVPAFRWSFPARNRIMSALAQITVVVEAAESSGSLITAAFAAQLGRDVGAVPGRVTARGAAGSNRLLREGASVIRGAEDVLDELFGAGARPRPGGQARPGESPPPQAPPGESPPAGATPEPRADPLEPALRRACSTPWRGASRSRESAGQQGSRPARCVRRSAGSSCSGSSVATGSGRTSAGPGGERSPRAGDLGAARGTRSGRLARPEAAAPYPLRAAPSIAAGPMSATASRPPCVLSIAGSDSGGGAGIQADLKAFARCGVHGMTAITAVTVQNTVEVRAVHPLPPEAIVGQVHAVADDIGVDAVKVGMLGTTEIIEAVARALDLVAEAPVVIDPVMVAESGAPLLDAEASGALRDRIVPRAAVVTPNVAEAAVLAEPLAVAGPSASDAGVEDVERLVRAVHRLGPEAVVVTGGHRPEATDLFFDGERLVPLAGERHPEGAAHGSGCTHSSALAAHLALGLDPLDAARRARAIAGEAVRSGLRGVGAGAGPVDALGLARMR